MQIYDKLLCTEILFVVFSTRSFTKQSGAKKQQKLEQAFLTTPFLRRLQRCWH